VSPVRGPARCARRDEGGLGYPVDADFVVLADTEGNLFCVIN